MTIEIEIRGITVGMTITIGITIKIKLTIEVGSHFCATVTLACRLLTS
jgi:hypothetical protein